MVLLATGPVNRVLEIPELLDMVFGYLDELSNVSNALVCKRWSEVALDALWRELHDLHRLFGILKPLKKVGDDPKDPWVRLSRTFLAWPRQVSGVDSTSRCR